MDRKLGLLSEPVFYFITLFVSLLFIFNYDTKLGIIYTLFGVVSAILYFFLKDNAKYRINGVFGNSLKQWVNAGVFFVIFAIISLVIAGVFQSGGQQQSMFGVLLKPMAESNAYAPVLAKGVPSTFELIATFVVYTFLIPYVETVLFFGRGFEMLVRWSNVPDTLASIRMWAVIVIISLMFMYFHIQVRGITNVSGLVLTFLFGVISCAYVVTMREIEPAANAHVIWNGAIMVKKLGIF